MAGLVLLVFIDIPLPELLIEHVHHAAYLIVGLMVMSIITIQLMGLHKDQQSALQRELELAQKNARINAELLQAEQNYSRAQRLAGKHKQQLASASHDLRQPIVSLRASIDAIAVSQTPLMRQQLRDAFDYLEQLCNQHLQQSRPENDPDTDVIPDPELVSEHKAAAYPASLILGTVQRMFSKEAADRGIELRKVDCSVLLNTEPLVVMRIVSNLVANAIKHHPGGQRARVLLGCRRRHNRLEIMICDNGSGMTDDEIRVLQQPYQKSDDSAGEGLGLAIIQRLAAENGLVLHIESEVARGSCFRVTAPIMTI